MFGKKKANKTVDSRPASSDTSLKPEATGAKNDTSIARPEVTSASSPAEKPENTSEKRSEPRLFTQTRTKDEPAMSSKPHSTNFRPEIPKRPLEIPTRGSANRPSNPVSNNDGKKLTVGRDIRLSGEIGSCDILVVEGHVEAQINDCQRIEICDGGTFVGTVTVDEAEISGTFQGELNAHRVSITGTAEIQGSINYGSLQVASGARIKGSLDYVEGNDDPAHRQAPSAAITIPRKSDDS
ncbi:hypothetical protein LF95_10955 [Thalassospira sp. TSL5-1]|nr:hypothetical protein LF95_10955 [Thalassospira sp. TSL5-1]